MQDLAVDQGTSFGTWPDPTARFMYHDVMPALLSGIDTTGIVADLGGGNGLLKRFIPQAITVDIDAAKKPDIVDDILTHRGSYNLVVLRYVLHYLTDDEVLALFKHLRSITKRVLLIQFCNDDIEVKLANSVNETKHFRAEWQLHDLWEKHWQVKSLRTVTHYVEADFYRWRLNHPNPTGHWEDIVAAELEPRS